MKLKDYEYYRTDLGVLYHGDCLEVLPLIQSEIDLVLTDPPYGITQNKWDNNDILFDCFDLLCHKSTIVFTCNQPTTSLAICRYIDYFKCTYIWIKPHAQGFLNCKKRPLKRFEDIIVLSKKILIYNPQIKKKRTENIRSLGKNVQSTNYGKINNVNKAETRTIPNEMTYPDNIIKIANSQEKGHPTIKPVKLFEYLLKTFSSSKCLILDPFLGSGTTAIACEKTNRRWSGIEISKEYCEIAKNRIKHEANQIKLFV